MSKFNLLLIFLLILFVLVVAYGFIYFLKKQHIIGGGQLPDFTILQNKLKDYLSKTHEKIIIYYSDIKNTMPYTAGEELKQIKINPHIGQRKLLLNELQFHSYYHKPNQLCIYTGSAPCEHLPAVMNYYPDLKFLLIDGNYHIIDADYLYIYQNKDVISTEHLSYIHRLKYTQKRNEYDKLTEANFLSGAVHNVLEPAYYDLEKKTTNLFEKIYMSNNNVFIIQDYLTLEMCIFLQECMEQSPFSSVLYLSDIRSAGTTNDLSDRVFVFDNTLQAICLHYLQPDFAMLKYHPPFFDGSLSEPKRDDFMDYIDEYKKIFDIDIIKDYKENIHRYFKYEQIFLQPWAPPASSESRYIVSKKNIYNHIEIDHKEYEDKFAYLNTYRNYYFNDMFLKRAGTLPDYPYCGCFDCILEQTILLGNKTGSPNPKEIIKRYNEINKHLYYDLKNKVNKKSVSHGWNTTKHSEIYFLGRHLGRPYRVGLEEIQEIRSEDDAYLTNTFPKDKMKKLFNFINAILASS